MPMTLTIQWIFGLAVHAIRRRGSSVYIVNGWLGERESHTKHE
jgi:hypothetical protein